MTEMNAELLARLVVGRKRDGRCKYDPLAKQALICECLKPGVSVARMAMLYGINANLLRSWIAKSGPPYPSDTARALPAKGAGVCSGFRGRAGHRAGGAGRSTRTGTPRTSPARAPAQRRGG